MHRWFFLNDEISCKTAKPSPPTDDQAQFSAATTSSILSVPATNWCFKVQFNGQLCVNEFLAISGSCSSLGNWKVQASVALVREESTSLWTLTVALPLNCDIHYRYFVCGVDFRGRKFVRSWETHFGGRVLSHSRFQNVNSKEYEIFGVLNQKLKIERGWLAPFVTVVQLKFNQSSFKFDAFGEKVRLQVKVTPIKLKTWTKCGEAINPLEFEEQTSGATFAYCEVASVQPENGTFHQQLEYGTACGPQHSLIFNITLNVLEQCALLIDLYKVKSDAAAPPNLFGYQYIMPRDLVSSDGTLDLALICGLRHRPMGAFKCDYLIVRPLKPFWEFNLQKTFQSYWNAKHSGLFCGHRGCGPSFWLKNNILRENCVKSFDLAIQHGADMIEFDVQLTKDLRPIIHHDTELCVSKNFDQDLWQHDIIHLPLTAHEMNEIESGARKLDKVFSVVPVSKFTLEQLARVKVYEPAETAEIKINCTPAAETNRPFITLQQALAEIKAKIGFVVDIKWPQTRQFDKNQYVDVILSVVLKNAGSRRIIFFSSDADICTMVRLKQNLYPIMFGVKTVDDKLRMDPPKTISCGIHFAQAMELWGIGINCAHILHLPGNVHDLHERGLCVFSWGTATRYDDKRKYLKKLGVAGIICDRLNHVLKPLDLKKTFVYFVPLKNTKQ